MKTFKNTAANLDSESTVVLFAQCDRVKQLSRVYVEARENELKESRATHLFTQAGVRYFGFL